MSDENQVFTDVAPEAPGVGELLETATVEESAPAPSNGDGYTASTVSQEPLGTSENSSKENSEPQQEDYSQRTTYV